MVLHQRNTDRLRDTAWPPVRTGSSGRDLRAVKYTVVPIMHPAAILRGAFAQEPFQIDYLRTALKVAREGTGWIDDLSVAPKGANLYPTLEDLDEFTTSTTGPYTVDIECAGPHLECVGFCDVASEKYVCVRFRVAGGGVYDPPSLHQRFT